MQCFRQANDYHYHLLDFSRLLKTRIEPFTVIGTAIGSGATSGTTTGTDAQKSLHGMLVTF